MLTAEEHRDEADVVEGEEAQYTHRSLPLSACRSGSLSSVPVNRRQSGWGRGHEGAEDVGDGGHRDGHEEGGRLVVQQRNGWVRLLLLPAAVLLLVLHLRLVLPLRRRRWRRRLSAVRERLRR